MSLQLIQEYHHKVQEILRYGGSRHETNIRPAFQILLEQYCADKNIELILELEHKTPHGKTIYPDGTLKDALRFYHNSRPEGHRLIASGRLNAKDMIVDRKLWKMIQEDFGERS